MRLTRSSSIIAFVLLTALRGSAAPLLDRVEFVGISAVPETEVRLSIDAQPGEEATPDLVRRGTRSLQELYTQRGYWSAKIAPRISNEGTETVLTFTIEEGDPIRIASIELDVNAPVPKNKRKMVKRVKENLLDIVDVNIGDVLSQPVANSIRSSLESHLLSEEWVGSETAELRPFLTDPPKGAEFEKLRATRWIRLVIPLRIGDRVRFGFRGHQFLTQSQLQSVVDEQKAIGFGRDYVEEIRARILSAYAKYGFSATQVTAITKEPSRNWLETCEAYSAETVTSSGRFLRCSKEDSDYKQVSFLINEGVRDKIEAISFEGNRFFTDEQLIDRLDEYATKILQQRYYVADDLNRAADALAGWMRSQGFLSAKIASISRVPTGKDNNYRVAIYLYEGPRTYLRDVVISGLSRYPETTIRDDLSLKKDEPLDLTSFSEGLERVKQRYRNDGYLDFFIRNEGTRDVVRYFQRNRVAEIRLEFEEGQPAVVGQVRVTGSRSTRTEVILREATFKSGGALTAQNIAESELNLRKLGIFSSVAIEYRPRTEDPAIKDVLIRVGEIVPGVYSIGAGFRNDLGIRVFGEVGYNNLWRRNHSATLAANANRRIENYRFIEFQTSIGYRWPFFLLDRLTFRPRVSFENRQFIRQFDALSSVIELGFDRSFLRDRLQFGLNASYYFVIQSEAASTENNGVARFGSLTPSVSLDLRDNPLNPTRGFFANLSYEHALPTISSFRSSPLHFQSIVLRADGVVPLPWGMSLLLSVRTGWIHNLVPRQRIGDVAIPAVRRFSLGGVGSIRGYRLQELSQFDNTYNPGTLDSQSFVNYKIQWDLPVVGDIRFGPFWDAGQLFLNRFSLGDRDLRMGVGVGLRYSTPVGPINFDYGCKVNQPSDASRLYEIESAKSGPDCRFHLSVGALL